MTKEAKLLFKNWVVTIKKIIIQFTEKKLVRNVIIMATGTMAAQAVAMGLSPIITRMYGPEAFGVMGVFAAIIQVIAPIAALTYPIAIVLPKSDVNAKGLIRLSLYISFMIAIIASLILYFFNIQIVDFFQISEIASFLYLIPLVIIFSGIMQVSEQWLIRTKQFGINAKVSFMQSVIINFSKVGVGFYYPLASVLIVFTVLGDGLRALMMIIFARKANYKESKKTEEEHFSIRVLAKKHRDFPLFRASEVFLSAISQSLPILLLTTFFGPASAGFYTIGRTALGLPSKLIGQSIGDVLYPRINEAAINDENVHRLIKRSTIILGGIGLIPFGFVVLFGPWLFEFVFGTEWYRAGEYARWIALATFSIFINKPSVRAMPVLSAQFFHLNFTIIMLITRSLALLVGYYVFNSDLVAIAFFGVSGALLNLGLILITLNLSKKFDAR